MLKRLFDIVVALLGIVLTAPVWLVAVLLLWLEAPGQVFFRQQRLGQDGKVFWLYKLRKFRTDLTSEGPNLTIAGDDRMTPLGRILERTKIDELPQFYNVLRGDMSIVGPRPESLAFADMFQGDYRQLLNYKPGIFGPNQVYFRNEGAMYPPSLDREVYYRQVLFPLKAETDLKYFHENSFFGDLRWVVLGIVVTLGGVVSLSEHTQGATPTDPKSIS